MNQLKDVKKILISRLRFMGDIILSTPVIRALNEFYPDAQIAYLAETPYISLLENHPLVRKLYPFDFRAYRRMNALKSTFAQLRFFKSIRDERFDLAFDLFGNPRSALQIWLAGARSRVGGDFSGRSVLYTDRVNYHGKKFNAIQFHLHALEAIGIPVPKENPRTKIFTTESEDVRALDFLQSKGLDLTKPIVGIHPGATWPAKKWFIERFARLARQLVRERDLQVYITAGPGEQHLVDKIRTLSQSDIFSGEVLVLRQLAALLKQFDVYISNDCGPLHLAAAVGTRTIGIFGPGEPDVWFPYSEADGHRFIHHPPSCWLCHKDFCESMLCMKAITVEEVFNAAVQSLNDNNFPTKIRFKSASSAFAADDDLTGSADV
ncbi:glycosyltransferase family 9 protein [candidate division KSB1 bacterium]|nr:glycosyltransferase family 9 protein [candidate division KSB1 bacterium]